MIKANTVRIKVTGFGRETVELTFDENPTLADVLSESGITLAAGEQTSVNGEVAEGNDVLENGDTIQIVGKKAGGKQ